MTKKVKGKSIVDITDAPMVDRMIMEKDGWKRKQPEWVKKEGFLFVGAWGSPMFMRRCGESCHELAQGWDFVHGEEFVRDVKNLGCNSVVSHFGYIFGKKAQKREWECMRTLIKNCRKYKLRVGVYFSPHWAMHESLAGEERALLNHIQRDARGNEISVGQTGNIKTLCYHHPESVKHFEKMIAMAVTDLKADFMHFDTYEFGGTEPHGCRCERCREDFRGFLNERYRRHPEIAEQRFGFSDVSHVEPPGTYPEQIFPHGPVTEPLWQEWIEFRCFWTEKFMRHFSRYVHSLNPDVAIEMNFGVPVRENTAASSGLQLSRVAGYSDGLWSEDAYSPEILPTGELISRIRQFKICRRFDNYCLTYMLDPDQRMILRNMAHAAAFNGGTPACVGQNPRLGHDYRKFYELRRGFIRWLQRHGNYYVATGPAADIAVWRSERSSAFGSDLVDAAAMRMEQLCIEERIPFTIVFDEWLDTCGPEKILILPNVECMTAREGILLKGFVKKGGALFIGQESSLYDGWRRKRDDFLLRDIMGPDAGGDAKIEMGTYRAIEPGGMMVGLEGTRSGGSVKVARFGKGRVAYVPEIVNAAKQPSRITAQGKFDFGLDYTNWRVPEKKDEVMGALRWLTGSPRFEVQAPRGVVAEYLFQKSQKRYLVHLINFKGPDDAPVIHVRMRLRPGETVKNIEIISPDPGGPPKFEWHHEGGGIFVEIRSLDLYAVVVIPVGG